jgi:hypothetical protein
MASPGLNVQNPIKAGAIRAFIDLSSVADSDWHDLSSADFKDSITGEACPAGLKFEWLGVTNEGDAMHIKYRARAAASDVTTNEIRVGQIYQDDLGSLRDEVSTIAYKKNDGADVVTILAGFSAR